MRRTRGRDHHDTLAVSANLAVSLPDQDKHAEVVAIQREVLASTTCLLGAEHEATLILATNLVVSLSHCDQRTEAQQLFLETLACLCACLA